MIPYFLTQWRNGAGLDPHGVFASWCEILA